MYIVVLIKTYSNTNQHKVITHIKRFDQQFFIFLFFCICVQFDSHVVKTL